MKKRTNRRTPAWAIHNTSEELITNIRRRHRQQKIRRRRIAFASAVCMITVLLISSVVFAQGNTEKTEYQPIAVEAGDTLWDLAGKYYPNMDRRSAIDDIKEVNNLASSEIFTGDVLLVPELQ